ncbi:hypothetical protein P262_01327 [Cronobacter malonaticus]|uniref:Uncharacterized protein n=1 Tax=Cronobacter malonaticus TaxID=413503 RepID=V5TVY2_9ENTR|nr:hypothetical protein P262_01327 [Cronobacter malonaticus]
MKQSRVIKAGCVIQVKVTRLPGYFFNDLFSLAGKHMRITHQHNFGWLIHQLSDLCAGGKRVL